jgi:uncharacterized integral membrane protein (TIGR00697 family)
MPSSKQYLNQEAFEAVLGSTFRITLASIIAYFIGSIVNAKVMDYLKKKHSKYLFVRAITSTFVGQNLDNAIFMTLAFVGVLPVASIITMIVGGTVIEVLYEIMLYPLTKTCIRRIKGYR